MEEAVSKDSEGMADVGVLPEVGLMSESESNKNQEPQVDNKASINTSLKRKLSLQENENAEEENGEEKCKRNKSEVSVKIEMQIDGNEQAQVEASVGLLNFHTENTHSSSALEKDIKREPGDGYDGDDETIPGIPAMPIKEEPSDNDAAAPPVVPPVQVEMGHMEPAVGNRPSCRFGVKCYRSNAEHRNAEAHPGDRDYTRPVYPPPPPNAPACPHWESCYRRNPAHFQEFSHPNGYIPPHSGAAILARNLRNWEQEINFLRSDSDDSGTDFSSSDEYSSDEGPDSGMEE